MVTLRSVPAAPGWHSPPERGRCRPRSGWSGWSGPSRGSDGLTAHAWAGVSVCVGPQRRAMAAWRCRRMVMLLPGNTVKRWRFGHKGRQDRHHAHSQNCATVLPERGHLLGPRQHCQHRRWRPAQIWVQRRWMCSSSLVGSSPRGRNCARSVNATANTLAPCCGAICDGAGWWPPSSTGAACWRTVRASSGWGGRGCLLTTCRYRQADGGRSHWWVSAPARAAIMLHCY